MRRLNAHTMAEEIGKLQPFRGLPFIEASQRPHDGGGDRQVAALPGAALH